jgi:ribosomal protein S18 acetylase RimI-like enzyme
MSNAATLPLHFPFPISHLPFSIPPPPHPPTPRYNPPMPLPILKSNVTVSNVDLVRFAHQVEVEWSRHLSQETVLDFGTAMVNPQLKTVHDANRILDAALLPGTDPATAFESAEQHFAAAGAVCYRWLLNPSLSSDRTQPLADYLLARGYVRNALDILHLPRLPQHPVRMVGDLKIIPARASFRHYRALAEQQADHWKTPEMVEAIMLHLDDPHFEALIALKEGHAAGTVGVQIIGELGSIQDVFISNTFRRHGIGRTLMARALEICVRSLLRNILISVDPGNIPAAALYRSLGFEKIGELVAYAAPGTAHHPRP